MLQEHYKTYYLHHARNKFTTTGRKDTETNFGVTCINMHMDFSAKLPMRGKANVTCGTAPQATTLMVVLVHYLSKDRDGSNQNKHYTDCWYFMADDR